MSGPYILGKWHDFTTYQCPLCPFDCMDEEQALDHYQSHFTQSLPPREDARPLGLGIDDTGHVIVLPQPVEPEIVEPVRKRRSKKGA